MTFSVYSAGLAPGDLKSALSTQMKPPHFPVGLDVMKADLRFGSAPYEEVVRIGNAEVRSLPVDHPNGCAAYRVDYAGKTLVYATDLEHNQDLEARLSDFAQKRRSPGVRRHVYTRGVSRRRGPHVQTGFRAFHLRSGGAHRKKGAGQIPRPLPPRPDPQ